MATLKRTLFIVLLFVAGVAIGNAQTSNGTIIGAITDPAGQVVAGAAVTATSVDTGAVKTTTTNSEGEYRIESLQPGVYDVSASAVGFQTTLQKGLQVPGAIVTASIVLKVGQASDKIEVTADNAVLNTDNGQISGTIGELEIANLPIASLNPYELALTLPGVINTQQGGFSNGVNFNVGGGRPRANNFLIEGQDNNDAGIQGQGLQPGNEEAVKEVVIIENAYTAEYGHGAGSVSNLIYKSGTNQFHGAGYERLRNSSLDAIDHSNNYFQDPVKTKYRENLPGFRIGGPIVRNKVFAFGSYQWDEYRSTANLSQLSIPTAAGLATLQQYASSSPNLANLLEAYGTLVGQVPQAGATFIALGPDPTTGVDRGTVEVGTVARNLGANTTSPELDLKGDYNISGSDTLNLRYIHTNFLAPFDVFNFPGQLPGFDTDQDGASHNAGIAETHTFTTNLINEFRLSYGRIGFTFGLPSSTTSNPLFGGPGVSVTGLTGYGIPTNIPQGRFHNTYQVQDTVTWIKGKHTWKFGEDIAQIRVRDGIPFNFYGSVGFANSGGPVTVGEQSVRYTGLANLIDDFGGNAASISQNFGSPTAQPRLFSQNYFATDTWRPTPTLSLDLGFRYEYNGAPFNAVGTPYPAIDQKDLACFPLDPGAHCNTKQTGDFGQWGPRAGIAWSPTLFGQHKTVVRTGFGVFYDVVFTNIIDNIQASAPNAASPLIQSSTKGRGTPTWIEHIDSLNKTPLATNTADPIVNHLLSPRTLHWNLNVEQELPWATSLQIGYIGERGTHLYGQTNLNPYVGQYEFGGERVIPTRGAIVARDNSEDSEYTGLWTELDHKFNHQFLFRAAYTYGHALDDGSEIFTTLNQSSYQFSRYPIQRGTTDWGNSAYDARQRLALSYIWTPAVWHTEGAMKIVGNIVNRWSLSGITQFQAGSPENVENGFDVDGDGIGNDRPSLGNPKAPLTTWAADGSWFGVSGLCSGPSFYNTGDDCHPVSASDVHWIVPGPDEYGKPVGRNSLTSPGFQLWNVAIQRSFKLHEQVVLDFRGDLFNIFNHGNFGIENTTLSSGVVTDAYNDFGPNYFTDPYPTVYGHRNAQFFMKISF